MRKERVADSDVVLGIYSSAGFMFLSFLHLVTESILNVAVIKSCAKHRQITLNIQFLPLLSFYSTAGCRKREAKS